MSSFSKSDSKVFRPSAIRFLICFLGIGMPIYFASAVWRDGRQIPLKPFFVGLAAFVPVGIIAAGLVRMACPVRISAEGIHSQSMWGLPCFMRWQDMKSARKFSFFNLPWLRIYPAEKGTVIWMPLFQSSPDQFKLEMQRLAPLDSPVLSHLQ